MKAFRGLSVATAVVTYALVVLGGVVRVSGPGWGCPDWPLCHGRLLPPLETGAIIEYTHRLVGALASPLILMSCAVAWLSRRHQRSIALPAILVPVLLLFQIGLGGVVV